MNIIVKDALKRFVLVIATTVLLQWMLVNSYVHFCAPPTILGVFKTFFNLGSPLCHAINHIQFELAKHYITIWSAAGISLIAWGTNMLNPKINSTDNIRNIAHRPT
jgi:hypothetical protein